MFRGLLYRLPTMLRRVRGALARQPGTTPAAPALPAARQLERMVIADGVMRTLFDDYAEHRNTPRGDEEIGWILLGTWQDNEAMALAALPAGADRDASVGHVRFNADAQALASRILRQKDKRLRVLGVVHTHPGRMRYPSEGDLQGDSRWVGQLRAGEAIFGIGTADVGREDAGDANIYGDMCFSWYALSDGDRRYRPLPVEVRRGADLAVPLRPLWNVLESSAEPLNRLCSQLADVKLEAIDEGMQPILAVRITLAQPNHQLRLLLSATEARYYLDQRGELTSIDPHEGHVERAVYLVLAELAKASAGQHKERMLVES